VKGLTKAKETNLGLPFPLQSL